MKIGEAKKKIIVRVDHQRADGKCAWMIRFSDIKKWRAAHAHRHKTFTHITINFHQHWLYDDNVGKCRRIKILHNSYIDDWQLKCRILWQLIFNGIAIAIAIANANAIVMAASYNEWCKTLPHIDWIQCSSPDSAIVLSPYHICTCMLVIAVRLVGAAFSDTFHHSKHLYSLTNEMTIVR